MRRTQLLRKSPLRAKPPAPVKRERAPLVLVPRAEPSRSVMAPVPAKPAKTVLKVLDRVRNDIRQSAKGEECYVRLTGVCCGGTEHTIWSHAPLGSAGKGGQIKALDLCGAFCCTACDAVVDGQAPMPAGMTRASVLLDWFHGHMRSLVRLAQRGLI